MPNKGNKCCCGPSLDDLCLCHPSYQYRFTLSGITGSAFCLALNRTWTLSLIGGGICRWQEIRPGTFVWLGDSDAADSYDEPPLILGFSQLLTTNVRRYTATEFDCETGGVFEFLSGNLCSGWPDTITIEKV